MLEQDAIALPKSERYAMEILRRTGHFYLQEVGFFQDVPCGYGRKAIGKAFNRPHRQRWQLRAVQLQVGDTFAAKFQSAKAAKMEVLQKGTQLNRDKHHYTPQWRQTVQGM